MELSTGKWVGTVLLFENSSLLDLDVGFDDDKSWPSSLEREGVLSLVLSEGSLLLGLSVFCSAGLSESIFGISSVVWLLCSRETFDMLAEKWSLATGIKGWLSGNTEFFTAFSHSAWNEKSAKGLGLNVLNNCLAKWRLGFLDIQELPLSSASCYQVLSRVFQG